MLRPSPRANFAWARLCLCLLLALASAGVLAAPPRIMRFAHLSVEQGLAQESVLTILQDRQGFMWFGSQAGLSRFDGYRMTVYKNDPGDPSSISDNYVLCSLEDAQGRLWFGTKGGLNRFDRDGQKFVRYDAGTSAANRSVSAIIADGHGGLWLATTDGLKHFDPASGRFSALRHDAAIPTSIGDDRVESLALDGHGNLWAGTASGLERLAAGSTKFEHFATANAQAGKGGSVKALSAGPLNVLWVGTTSGLEEWRLDGPHPSGRSIGAAEGMDTVRILTLYHDRNGALWVGTDTDGLKWRDPVSGKFISYRHQLLDRHSLSDNQISALHQDHTGTLWVGTWYAGINSVDLSSGGFERFEQNPGDPLSLSSNKVRAIAADAAGRVYLGTSGGGLNRLDRANNKIDVWRHDFNDKFSLSDDLTTALAVGSGNRVWVGTQTGVNMFDAATGRFTQVALGPDPLSNFIQRVFIDRNGTVWVLTRGGMHQLDGAGKLVRTYRHDVRDPASMGDNWGFSMLEDRKGRLWIGTDNGLDRFDRDTGSFAHYRHDPKNPSSISHNRVHYLFQARDGTLWAGTAGGLNRVDESADGHLRFQFYPLTRARAADPVGGILEDKSGRLWVSTTAGMVRLDPKTGQFKNFQARDGLLDGSYFVGSAFGASDGTMYFGGLNGMTAFLPEQIHDNPYAPPVLVTDFLVFNESVQSPQLADRLNLRVPIQDANALTLEARDSVFALEFAALHHADPQRNRYAYKLEGFDEHWVDTDSSKRFVTYTNLDPGHYTFRVKASNKDGVWSQNGAALSITITPPYWKTWWFRSIAVLLVSGAAYAGFRVRIRALLVQKKVLEEQVSTRTAELVLQKESVEIQKESVEQAHRNISLLSDIGRTLTANLDTESIMLMLYGHVNELMDASVFGIGFYRPDQAIIEYPFAIEQGKRYAPYSRSMHEPNQLAVWCIEHEMEVFINNLNIEYKGYIDNLALTSDPDHLGTLGDGSLPTAPRSMLYVPIMVNGRTLGVISVHSYRENAYERIHLDMLRTLASYVGVAFDNADAYRQLKDTQQQLVAQEKLAALGSLVAGVAHELNTPIGNSLLMAGALQEKTELVTTKFNDMSIRRSDLGAYIAESQEAAALIMRSLKSAADLVNSFKQVAVDQASAQRRVFNLETASHEVIATMMNQVRKGGHTLDVEVPSDIEMDSFPGPYGQVVINFINNALLHAFDGSGGHMNLIARRLPGERVQIEFHDDGCGIPPEFLPRIFDPFFTTKLGQGGSGLGLNITYNIVTSLLGGHIRVESRVGAGTSFILDLPLTASAQSH
ncbi:MAG: two-component regulator propeller domain-containing protein [Pseudomonadota bacterium]